MPSGAKPMNHCDQPTSTLTIFLAMRKRGRIRRQRGQEQRTRHRGGRKRRPHHIGADPAGGRPGFGAIDARDVADDRIDRAAAARGVGRRRRRQHEIGEGDRIAEPDGAAAEAVHQQQREPPAEPALAVADREHEGADDQPHRAFGKAAQHPAQRLVGIVLDIAADTPATVRPIRPTAPTGIDSRIRPAITAANIAK